MRIATMIISLLLMVVVGLQSCTVYVGGSATGQENLSQGGAVGLLVALLFFDSRCLRTSFPPGVYNCLRVSCAHGAGGLFSRVFRYVDLGYRGCGACGYELFRVSREAQGCCTGTQ